MRQREGGRKQLSEEGEPRGGRHGGWEPTESEAKGNRPGEGSSELKAEDREGGRC